MTAMLPDSIPESLWAEFKLMRKKIRAPMTPHAETIILVKLEKWRIEFGANPIDVLNESIEKSWRGVFLNGHGMMKDAGEFKQTVCCQCGGSLKGGHIFTSKGRRCHEC